VPYGTKSPDAVLRFSRENLAFLKSKHVKLIVVACNTASAVAVAALRDEEEVPIVGVIEPGARAAARATKTGRIGVIGTTATIRSSAYAKALHGIDPEIEIWSRPCPLFVPLVEEGWLDGEITYLTAKRYLDPLESFGADALVLGCTHYPLLKGVISKVLGGEIVLVDSARETAVEVERVLGERGLRNENPGEGGVTVYVSDVPYLIREVGERFLRRPISAVEQVEL
jgi:glutamate racemase